MNDFFNFNHEDKDKSTDSIKINSFIIESIITIVLQSSKRLKHQQIHNRLLESDIIDRIKAKRKRWDPFKAYFTYQQSERMGSDYLTKVEIYRWNSGEIKEVFDHDGTVLGIGSAESNLSESNLAIAISTGGVITTTVNVEALIRGQPSVTGNGNDFILDTGSTFCAVSNTTPLGIRLSNMFDAGLIRPVRTENLSLANGAVSRQSSFLMNLGLDGKSFEDMEVLLGARNFLGMNLFRKTRLLIQGRGKRDPIVTIEKID